MARYITQFDLPQRGARVALEARARRVVQRVFGWKPQRVEAHSRVDDPQPVCCVEVQVDLDHKLEFWISGDQLVNVPPKNRR